MAWCGVIRDSEAIAEWQRSGGRRRRDPQRALAERLGRWVALPLVTTVAMVLAVIPGTVVSRSDAAQAGAPGGGAGVPVALGGINLRADDHLPARERADVLAEQALQSVATTGVRVDPAVAQVEVARIVQIHGPDGPVGPVGPAGIPVTVLAAYRAAAAEIARTDAACHLPWWLLAGIGRIESGHAAGGRVDATGTTRGRILGPRLDGSLAGTSVILDTDHGRWDGDTAYDRAVGPMQFLPGTWQRWGRDGNGDGVADPNNVDDAALAAGAYLCAGGRDLSTDAGIAAAVLSYNNSTSYLASVVSWGLAYRDGVTPTGDSPGSVPPAGGTPPPTTSTGPPTSTPPTSTATTSTPPTSTTTGTGTGTTGPPTSSPPSTTSTSSTTTTTTVPPTGSTCPPPTTTTSTTTTTTTGPPATTTTSTTTTTTGAPTTTTSTTTTTTTTTTGPPSTTTAPPTTTGPPTCTTGP